jgi:hypothetical protein
MEEPGWRSAEAELVPKPDGEGIEAVVRVRVRGTPDVGFGGHKSCAAARLACKSVANIQDVTGGSQNGTR